MLFVPTLLGGALTALPTVPLRGHLLGGGPLREWLLNHLLLTWMPRVPAGELIAWFAHATILQEWLLAMFIVVNLNVLGLPLLLGAGNGVIRLRNWLSSKSLELKREGVRR
jgi:hypothetical protein